MLIEEARWLGEQISLMTPTALFPMCNLGSSTETFRKQGQPWIDHYIFEPIRKMGGVVRHVDRRKGPGVDVVGDLSDPGFLAELSAMGFRSVVCSNLLEHISDREAVAEGVVSIVLPGGYIFATCPFQYPYHADPIDTLFRPGVEELVGLFPGTALVRGKTVTCGTYWDYVSRTPSELIRTAIGLLVPFYGPRNWYSTAMHLPWLFRNFEATCVVLLRDHGEA